MALSKELAEELTCPIDLEFFIEPMLLKCLHTLCKKDVEHMLNEDDLILCPVCQNISQKKDIKHDFKTQRLLDLHTADRDRLNTQLLCENCEDEVAFMWCEQCQGYFGEKCGKGHMKFQTSKHHKLIMVSTIIEENKSKIDRALQTFNDVSDSITGLRKDLSDCESKLDEIYKEGYDRIKDSEKTIIAAARSSHAKLRQNLKLEIYQHKRFIDECHKSLQSIESKAENESKLLEDSFNDKDQKAMLDKRMFQELTTQSRMKYEVLTKKLTQINIPSKDICVSISRSDEIVHGIENITVETKACESIAKQGDDLPKAATRPKTILSTKPKQLQHALAPETSISLKTLTLTDYTKAKALTTQSKMQFEDLTKELTEINIQSQDISVSKSRLDEIAYGIENITVETKAFDWIAKKSNDFQKPVTRPKTTQSTKPKKKQRPLAPETNIPSKTLTLTDYTKGKVKVQSLKFQIPEDGNGIRSIVTINNDLWLIMIDGSVNITKMSDNDTLSFQRQMRTTNQPTLILTKVVHGPQSKIIAGFKESANTAVYMTHLYEIDDKCKVSSIVGENRSFFDMAADDNHVYGLHEKDVSVYQYSGSSWSYIRNVALRVSAYNLCAHKQILTANNSHVFESFRYNLFTNRSRRVHTKIAFLFVNDSIGNVLIGDSENGFNVLLHDDSIKEMDLGEIKRQNIKGIALDNHGRILVLYNCGTLWRLEPE